MRTLSFLLVALVAVIAIGYAGPPVVAYECTAKTCGCKKLADCTDLATSGFCKSKLTCSRGKCLCDWKAAPTVGGTRAGTAPNTKPRQ
jgi:hypothetical protein